MGRNKSKRLDVPLRTKLKKDPGIPRLPDLKLRRAERKQMLMHASVTRTNGDPDSVMAAEPTLSSLAALAAAASGVVTPASDSDMITGELSAKTKEQLRRHYIRALHKVIDESDIVLLVLDARDPEGCRSRLVEEEVRRREEEGKRLVFVLNKIDLVPKDNAQAWLRYLRHTTPTLPFRSASNNQRHNLSSATAPALVRLLKAFRPSAQTATVGVVGYPNVGKSSLINSLKRSKVCSVAAQPGHTKELQTIQLERGLKIVDSPGVVFDDADEIVDNAGRSRAAKGSVLLRNIVKVEDIEDPIEIVEEILSRTDRELIKKLYNLPAYANTLEFLTMHAMTTGRLLKGGTPDILASSRVIITDWNYNKIPYFSVPPTVHPSSIPALTSQGQVAPGAENVGQARVVSELAPAFEMGDLFKGADAGAFGGDGDEMIVESEVEPEVEMDEAAAHAAWIADRSDMGEDEVDTSLLSNKRLRSASPSPTPGPSNRELREDPRSMHRMPKRLRRSHDVPSYDAPVHATGLSSTNPLNRRQLKLAAKRARRADRVRESVRAGGGMEIDDDIGLDSSLLASVDVALE